MMVLLGASNALASSVLLLPKGTDRVAVGANLDLL